MKPHHVNDRAPNSLRGLTFRGYDLNALVACYNCALPDGSPRENVDAAVSSGCCYWCGWNVDNQVIVMCRECNKKIRGPLVGKLTELSVCDECHNMDLRLMESDKGNA